MAKHRPQKRFSVSLDQLDYEAMRSIAEEQEPPLTLQYVINLAVKEFLVRRRDAQLEIPLTSPQRIRQ